MTSVGPTVPEGTRLVHVGPHKTGSTAIQVALHAARDRLAEHGVAYATTGGYRPRRAGWAIGVTGRPAGTTPPPMRAWHRLVNAVESAGAPRVCVSNEDFGRATPPQIARIVEDLGGERVRVLAVARRLDRYLPSQWQERVKAGDQRRYDEWLRVVLDTEDPEPDWDRRNVWFAHDVRALVDRWIAVTGPERFILIVSDESDHTVIPRTFESLLGLPAGFVKPDPVRSNRGLSWAETELIRETNQVFEDNGVRRPQRRPLLNGVLRDMQARPAPAGPKSPPLPDWAADRLRDLSDQRVADVRAVGDLGVQVIGDPELMRMPADVSVAASPLRPPPLDLSVAAHALASLVVIDGEPDNDGDSPADNPADNPADSPADSPADDAT